MSEILVYTPTYSPDIQADTAWPRPYVRATNEQIAQRIETDKGRIKPTMYMDAIDSILNIRPDVHLVVADAKSTDSIRTALIAHNKEAKLEHSEMVWSGYSEDRSAYTLELYPEKMSQWIVFNDVLKKYRTADTKYFVYSSSDIIWQMDWVGEAIKAFEANPKLQILFPCVNRGDPNLPCQIAAGPRDMDPFLPPYQTAARAPVLNAYAMIFRMEFLDTYGGYPNIYRNCFTESFLHFMCEAMGGEMRVLPRGWCFHWGEGDKWVTPGSAYYYTEEKFTFENIMNKVLMYKAMNQLSVNLFKEILYKK